MRMKKKLLITILMFLFISLFSVKTNAAYNYSPEGDVISSAESLIATASIDASNLKDAVTDSLVSESGYVFGALSDVAVDDNYIYLADKTNGKVVVLNNEFKMVTMFPKDETVTLNKPQGLYITDNAIYVCDYGNNRVAIFDKEYNLIRLVLTPDDAAFQNYEFRPKKIAVSRTGRMFVVAESVNEGILDFNPDGTFSRFYGMNQATVSAWKAFWSLFATEEQKKNQGLNFGASLLNLCIDSDEYVYTVSSPTVGSNFIKRLNYKGNDILNRNGYVSNDGDLVTISETNRVPTDSSTFIDIDVNEEGTYIVLDSTRGRIFAYDFEGNLLYTAGSLATAVDGVSSNQSKMFQLPEALCYFQDKVLAVDSKNRNLIVFEFTTFGALVNEATKLYRENKYEEAATKWEEVLSINSNYYLAYAGIGKSQLREGNYEEALTNLKLGNDTYNYSQAYKQYRYNKLSKVSPYILGVVLTGVVALLVVGFVKKVKTKEDD